MRTTTAGARALLLALVLASCDETSEEQSGGAGANAGLGGNGGSGGSAGSGGSRASGGAAGSGATTGSGGATGSAGSAGASGGSGGATGSGGTGGGAGNEVDASTLSGKLVMGYQGWFACPGDGAPPDRWWHWFSGQPPNAQNLNVDMWPDVSELAPDELFNTDMSLPGGERARLFSSWTTSTTVRHFRWMQEHGLDGVLLQRFLNDLGDPAFRELRDKVLMNVRAGAEAHGRVFAVMYDVSGTNAEVLAQQLAADWAYLVHDRRVTESPRYLRHRGKPLLAIWGLGFNDRPATAAQARAIVDHFTSGAPAAEQVTLMGGVPTHWRTLSGDAKPEPEWTGVYRSFDVISPWAVGRYADDAGADSFGEQQILPDIAEARAAGSDYLPVVFPGFSWRNLNGGPLNEIPRRGGAFFWRQFYNARLAGADMIYVAMFDELDEATAMFKIAPSAAEQPAGAQLVSLDIDGQALPSDWYLRVAGAATEVLRGTRALTPGIPITP